jgi:hypothetical protein
MIQRENSEMLTSLLSIVGCEFDNDSCDVDAFNGVIVAIDFSLRELR